MSADRKRGKRIELSLWILDILVFAVESCFEFFSLFFFIFCSMTSFSG